MGRMTVPHSVVKGHATANDFVIYFDPEGRYDPTEAETRYLCDRHRGVGGDGLIRLTKAEYVADLTGKQRAQLADDGAEWFMDYRNADGSLAEMCGNGTRLTARFAQSLNLLSRDVGARFLLGTRAGVKELTFRGDDAELGSDVFTVRMGGWSAGSVGEYLVTLPGMQQVSGGRKPYALGTFADLGNPHIVCVAEDSTGLFSLPKSSLPRVEDLDLTQAPAVSPALPHGQNVEFVRIDSAPNVADGGIGERATQKRFGIPSLSGMATMRVNERGVGETLSCGTGLCATGIVLRMLTEVSTWTITVRGGVLRVAVSDDDVTLTGSSTLVGEVTVF